MAGCEKEYPWTFHPDNTSELVVDGIITNELKPQCIRLSLAVPGLNRKPDHVSGAWIQVSDGNSVWDFTEPDSEPGTYYSAAFQAVIDHFYTLTIIINSDTFKAGSDVLPVTALENIVITTDKQDTLSRFVFTGSGQAAMTEVFYDWSGIPGYCDTYGYCYAQETYYVLNNVDENAIFSPPKQTIYFPEGTIIIRKKYSLTEAHQQFLRSLLLETDWSGGIFDVQHGNVATNLSSGATGFFAACMVLTDTTVVE
jgi:hypothetical protein